MDMHNLKKDAWFEGCYYWCEEEINEEGQPRSAQQERGQQQECRKLKLAADWGKRVPPDLVPYVVSDNDTRHKAFVGEGVEGMGPGAREIVGEPEIKFECLYKDEDEARVEKLKRRQGREGEVRESARQVMGG